MKDVELWLPQQTPTELVALRADGDVPAPLPDGLRRWVHHGSSISHCSEADGPTGTWPVVAAALGGVEVINLSQAGNAGGTCGVASGRRVVGVAMWGERGTPV
ncbi:hypothetical protein [Streptomyces europaeiscabiei]|uniref:hypothetical protein n=1 Tax=Streptomyces europaeiscabiei TaxID=146819 RepID=UPI002E199B7D|nr:hypothetical protein OG858_00825 [Streptomyces europaeiscabiei]